jgi:hypothetical protein
MLHHWWPGDLELPPVTEAEPSLLEDSSSVVHRVGDPLWTIAMNMALESHSWGERLRHPIRSVMNSRLLKRMALPGARPMLVGLLLLPMSEGFSAGTIGMFREKTHYKPPFLAHQLSLFLAPARYRVVKIACSCSKMVLRTMKNYKAHYSLYWFRPLLYSNSPTSSIFDIKDEQCYNGDE